MDLALGELLQDVQEVDDGEEIARRVVGQQLDVLIGRGNARDAGDGRVGAGQIGRGRPWRRGEHGIFWPRRRCWLAGARLAAVAEEAAGLSEGRSVARLTDLYTGTSCRARTWNVASWMPNILRISSRQFESTRSWAKYWNFITSAARSARAWGRRFGAREVLNHLSS